MDTFSVLNRSLYDMIPNEEHDRVFGGTASAECSPEFLVCDPMYFPLSSIIDKGCVVIDFGCGYNAQSYLFGDFKKYIGVDSYKPFKDEEDFIDVRRYQAPNTEFFNVSGQHFITHILPTLPIEVDEVFAICTFVPSEQLQELVRRTFNNCYVYYPN